MSHRSGPSSLHPDSAKTLRCSHHRSHSSSLNLEYPNSPQSASRVLEGLLGTSPGPSSSTLPPPARPMMARSSVPDMAKVGMDAPPNDAAKSIPGTLAQTRTLKAIRYRFLPFKPRLMRLNRPITPLLGCSSLPGVKYRVSWSRIKDKCLTGGLLPYILDVESGLPETCAGTWPEEEELLLIDAMA